ncbi:unnamed protein product, partial [Amoebophrya sp. A25]
GDHSGLSASAASSLLDVTVSSVRTMALGGGVASPQAAWMMTVLGEEQQQPMATLQPPVTATTSASLSQGHQSTNIPTATGQQQQQQPSTTAVEATETTMSPHIPNPDNASSSAKKLSQDTVEPALGSSSKCTETPPPGDKDGHSIDASGVLSSSQDPNFVAPTIPETENPETVDAVETTSTEMVRDNLSAGQETAKDEPPTG